MSLLVRLLAVSPLVLAGPAPGTGFGETPAPCVGGEDLRAGYDVESYWLDLRLDPARRRLDGSVTVEARVLAEDLARFELDLVDALEVSRVELLGESLAAVLERADAGEDPSPARGLRFTHADDRLACELPEPAARGEVLLLRVHYGGSPRAIDKFDGFHWAETPDGEPWIATSCQGPGAHSWWPCKSSFFHPEDKPARLWVDLTVPAGNYAVSNGKLEERRAASEGWETFRWRHDYPLETYAVTLNVAPYVVVEEHLELEGVEGGVPFVYYVLPGDLEKARLQFADVPEILEVFGRRFGPWPFPEAKVGLVQTPFWGMEHSTAVAYGSSFPAWLAQTGERDRYASRNRWFDYILVHELAHEWWGNAVSAADWGDFWIHEGFATYAEGVLVEAQKGRAAADRFFAQLARAVPRRGRLHRGAGTSSGEAYASILYAKGGLVLNTLRHYVDDDAAWWRILRTFNLRHRYGNASTGDFAALLEEVTGRSWERFLAEWVHGVGFPRLAGTVVSKADRIVVVISNDPPRSEGVPGFRVPLDLEWTEGDAARRERLWLEPGNNALEVACEARPRDLSVVNLGRVLGRHAVRVE